MISVKFFSVNDHGLGIGDELDASARFEPMCRALFFLAREWSKGAGSENVICAGSLICAVFIVPVGKTGTY
jgi:hypothetical protein